MDSRRVFQQGYGRGGGGNYRSAGRDTARMPSLSTGQGFYTVESLEGVTVVPPPQPAPPPPRLLPSEPYPQELPHPRMVRRLHPGDRGDFGGSTLFNDRRYPPPAKFGRNVMSPSPEFPFPPRHRDGPAIMHRRPPPFMDEPRMPGFFHGPRDPPPPSGARGPYGNSRPRWSDRARDRSRDFQRPYSRTQSQKTVKPRSQAKTINKGAADEKSAARKQNLSDGEGHKKAVENQMEVEKTDAVNEAIAEKGAKSEVKTAKIAPKDESKSNQKESGGTPQPVTPVAGKKRGVKGVTQTNKKPHTSAGPFVTQNDTEREAAEATCTEGLPDVGIKGADDAVSLPKPKGSKSEQSTSRVILLAVEPAKEDSPKAIETDGKEGREDAGQSAEIQQT